MRSWLGKKVHSWFPEEAEWLVDALLEYQANARGIHTVISDLKSRGMLDRTLVLMTGEFGRTPKINNNKGRDHWPNVFSYLITGGGIPGGRVIGASDGDAAYPADNPVTPENTLASVFDMVGLDLHQLHAAGVVDDTHGVPGLFSG